MKVMDDEVIAAGGIVIDERTGSRRVLLVHRPQYDDWSFPKGKLDSGETIAEAALREVQEETGLLCRIVKQQAVDRYLYQTKKGRIQQKVVHYFLMEPITFDISVPGQEVDQAEWLEVSEAAVRLTHNQDKKLVQSI